MDFERPPSVARKKRARRLLLFVGLVVAAALVTLGLSRMKPAAPSVARGTLWIDTVKRGEMLRQVRGSGTLVAEEIRWIPAGTEGRVERILGHPGDRVTENTIILELSNPELARVVLDAEWELKGAEADLTRQRVELASQLLSERAVAAGVRADFHQAELEAEMQDKLAKDGLTSELELKRAKLRADEQGIRHDLEEQRLEIAAQANDAQLAVQQARLEQRRARGSFPVRRTAPPRRERAAAPRRRRRARVAHRAGFFAGGGARAAARGALAARRAGRHWPGRRS